MFRLSRYNLRILTCRDASHTPFSLQAAALKISALEHSSGPRTIEKRRKKHVLFFKLPLSYISRCNSGAVLILLAYEDSSVLEDYVASSLRSKESEKKVHWHSRLEEKVQTPQTTEEESQNNTNCPCNVERQTIEHALLECPTVAEER